MERHWQAVDQPAARPLTVQTRAAPYVFGFLGLVAGVVARLLLEPLLGDRVGFLFFVPALLLAAGTGGLAPTVVITLASAVAGMAILGRHPAVVANDVDAALFVGLGVAIGFGGRWLRLAQADSAEKERRLTERQAHLQSILDTVPDAMILIDENAIVQSFSPAAERLLGWRRSEVVGLNVSMLMPSPDREAHDSYIARYKQTGEKRIIGLPRVVSAACRDGSVIPVELFVGETHANGQRFFTGFLQDLTERQAAESRVQALQFELVHLGRLSDMGEMTAVLAHELNQPLSAISNYLKGGQRLLEAENPESRAIPALARAAEQSLRAGEIIRRMREFVARGEAERRPESLRKLIEEASTLGLVGARERGVVPRFEWDPSIGEVLVDKIQVQQVVLNLLRNGMEAMETVARRELEVRTAAVGDGMAMVSVADTGPGIAPEITDRLFQPFVTTKGSQGMGVGLSICRTIIESQGGRIWAEPNPDGGAIFRFTLPLDDAVGA